MKRWLWILMGAALLLGCEQQQKQAPSQPQMRCTAEVTDGNGRFQVASAAPEAARVGRKAMLKAACEKMCSHRQDTKPKACAARCMVDIQAGKVGAQWSCHDATTSAPSAQR